MKQWDWRWMYILPAVIWIISLFIPALGWGKDNSIGFGWQILAIGWLGILSGQIGWLANLFLFISILVGILVIPHRSMITILVNVPFGLIVLQASLLRDIDVGEGKHAAILGPGYYVWLAAMICQLAFVSINTIGNVRRKIAQ